MRSLLLMTGVAAALCLSSPSTAEAAPKNAAPKAARPVAQPKAIVEPKARALYARAAKLYSGAKGLRLNWTVLDSKPKALQTRELRFDRKGHLFYRRVFVAGKGDFVEGKRDSVTAVDGKTIINYHRYADSSIYTQDDVVKFRPLGNFEAEDILGPESVNEVGLGVVVNENPLTAEGVEDDNFETLRAVVLPARLFKGEMCDLVRVTETSRREASDPLLVEQRTFWFARTNGRLMRWQAHAHSRGVVLQQTDAQVTLQQFDPKFGAGEWTFTVPKGTKRLP